MKNCFQMGLLLVFAWSFFPLSSHAELESADCAFMEGVTLNEEQRESLLSGNCTSCQCIQESFVQTDLSELEKKYRSELGEVLRLRFVRQKIPEFVQSMKDFDTLNISCGLQRLADMPCKLSPELEDEVDGVFQQYFNRENTSSCFPTSTISRASKYEKLNSDLVMAKTMFEAGADVDDFDDDPVLRVFKENFESLKDVNPNYQELKQKILTSPELKNQLTDQVQGECTQFFNQMEATFCGSPNKLPVNEEHMSSLLDFNKPESFPLKATYRDLELFTLNCQSRSCQENSGERTVFCHDRQARDGYDLDSLFSGDSNLLNDDYSSSSELSFNQQRYENYCPLLNCRNIDEALLVMDGETEQCQEREPSRSLGGLINKLNCGSDGADLLCEEEMLAELIKYYDPKKDEPLPPPEQLLGGRSYDDVSIEEKKQILKDHGYSEQALNFLGDLGLERAFGQKLEFEGEPLSAEQREFRELGRESARELEAQRQAEREQQVTQQRQEKEGPSFSERFASSKQKQKTKASDVRSPAQRSVSQRPTQQVSPTNYLNPLPKGDQARGQRTLERLSEQVRSKRERDVDHDYQELEGEIRQLRQEAEAIRDERERKAYEDEIARLENQVEELEREDVGQREGLGSRPREFSGVDARLSRSRNRIPQGSQVPQEENSRSENDEVTTKSVDGNSSSQQNLSTGTSASNERSPASLDQGESYENLSSGETARYLERSSEELPLLSLENLGEVTPGESFILGVRELEGLKRIEMLPENSGDEVLYRAVMEEGLSDEAKSSLLQSPFFQQYAHPDVKNDLMESLRESARHDELINLLGEQL